MAYWNVFGFKIPTSGGPMLRFLGARIILKGLKQSLRRQKEDKNAAMHMKLHPKHREG